MTTELKEISTSLAEACINLAILKLVENINYAGDEIIKIASKQCLIRPINDSANNKIIESQAVFNDAHTNLQVVIDKN